MVQLRIVHQRADGGEISNDIVEDFNAVSGYWERGTYLRGNQYNAAEYTHNWMFIAWEKTDNWWYGWPNPQMNYGAASGRNGSPSLGNDQTYGLGAYVTLFMWNNERWTFFFRVANVSGIGYTVTYHGDGADGGSTGQNTAVYGSSFYFQGNGFSRTGHTFAYWEVYDSSWNRIGNYASGQHYGNWNRTHGANVVARWSINSYKVNFYNNGKGTGVLITQNYNTTITCPTLKAVGYVFGGWATSAASTTVNKAGNSTFTLGAVDENYYAIWTENTNGRIWFSELQTVFGGSNPIYISEYRTQSGQTTANSRITLSANFKGKGP